jgi:D-alanyl-D-alanine-carboxypeptidase/D-alanyl-D-alanine-endopeptidase
VTLDDPVTDHLPSGIRVPSRGNRPIRLIDLATHTSGLPRMPPDFQPLDANDPYRDYASTSLYESLGKAQLGSKPGKRYAYSNFGAGLLGHVLAHKAGTPYDDLVRTRITEPLAMTDTRVSLTPSMKARLAKPYDADGSPSHPWAFDALAGAGALRSTANDLLTFAAANLRPEETPLADVLLAAQTLRFSGPPQGLGLGWHLGESGSVLWHNGGTGGYRSYLGIHREHGCAVVLLANTTSETMDVIAHGILDVLRGKEPAPLEVRKVLPLPEEDLVPYAGTYRLNDSVSFTLSVKDAGLFARLTGQEALRIFPESKERFFYRGVKAEIHFDLDETGAPAALVLHQGGREQRAERVR